MSQVMKDNNRIFGLDVLRAVAILLVLFSHIYFLLDITNPTLISLSGMLGYAGVELFFVLSGFLIGSILLIMFLSNSFNFNDIFQFLRRRWLRTLPNYYVVLLINILIGYAFNYDLSGLWKYFLFLQNFNSYQILFFSESWSLGIEEWTYLLVPFFLILNYRFIKNRKIGFLVAILFLIAVFHFLRYWFYKTNILVDMNDWNLNLKSIVMYRIDAILIGFLVAYGIYFYENILKKLGVYLFVIGIHAFFLQFFVLNVLGVEFTSHPIYFYVFYFTLSSITMALIMPMFVFWKSYSGIGSTIITKISQLSYSLYLVHYSIISFLIKYFKDTFYPNLNPYLNLVFYFTLLFILATLLYKYIEKPFMKMR